MVNHIFLRSLELSDCPQVHKWHNDADLYGTLIGTFHPVSMATVENWLKNRIVFSDKEVNFAICLAETSEHIGNIYLRDIDYVNRNGFLGAFIGLRDNRGKGYASEALLKAIEYAFQTLGLERLFAHALADNQPAIRHLEKCGFSIEGKMRNHVFKNGVYKDVVIMGLCRSEYRAMEGDK